MQKSGFRPYVGFWQIGSHLCIKINQLCGWPILLHFLICLFYPLYYNITSLKSLKTAQAFLGFAENEIIFWNFKFKIVFG